MDELVAIARIPVVVPVSSLAVRRLRAFQQVPHRQTAAQLPSRVVSRVKRHPKELVSVRSGLASGERTPQSAQVSMASIRRVDSRSKNALPIRSNGRGTKDLSAIAALKSARQERRL